MWSALVEKAYAKLFKSYEALMGGRIGEALVDFTGGIAEEITLHVPPKNLFKRVQRAHKRKNLMGCAIDATGMDYTTHLNNWHDTLFYPKKSYSIACTHYAVCFVPDEIVKE